MSTVEDLQSKIILTNTADKDIQLTLDGLAINYDKTTAPKNFAIASNGVSWTDGILNFSTGLGRLASIQEAFQAVELPPNAFTLKINDSLLCTDGITDSSVINKTSFTTTDGTSNLTINKNNITHTSSLGNNLNISSNQNLSLTADNIDLGTTEIIYPTLSTPARLRLKANGQIQVDNNGGGTTTPATVLNQVASGGGVLVEEVYNQRNAITGEFNRMSFFSKSNTGAKTEYARIHQNAPVITSGSTRGRIDMAVNVNGTMTDYLTLNGQTLSIGLGASLDCNSNNITEINTATTTLNATLTPQIVNYLNGDSSTSTSPKDPNLRQVYINAGRPATLQSAGTGDLPTWNTIVASATFSGFTWVATSNGNIFYTADPNITWTDLGVQMNGSITCMKVWNGYLVVGGTFTQDNNTSNTFNRIMFIGGTSIPSPISWANLGSVGFNDAVLCLEEYNNFLYVGGSFYQDGNSASNLFRLAIVDTSFNVYNTNNTSTDGFNSTVRAIKNDSGSNRFIIGGDFNIFTSGGSGFSQQYYTQIDFNSSTGYDVLGFFTLTPSLNNPVYNIVRDPNTNAMVIAGNFTSTGYTDYIFEMFWNGSSYQPQNFTYGSPSSNPDVLYVSTGTSILFWSQGSVLNAGSSWSISNAFSSTWSTAVYATWSQDNFSTSSSSQNPVVLYKRDTSQSLQILLNNIVYTQGGASASSSIILANKGNSTELIWSANDNAWYVISNNGANFT